MKTRIKMRMMSGDVAKKEKIAMLEKDVRVLTKRTRYLGPKVSSEGSQTHRSKSFKKKILMREKAVRKEQTRKEIKSSE